MAALWILLGENENEENNSSQGNESIFFPPLNMTLVSFILKQFLPTRTLIYK